MLEPVEIRWIDAISQDDELEVKEIRSCPILIEIGYLISMDKKEVKIVREYEEENHTALRMSMTIPRQMVLSIRQFSKRKKKII